MAALDKNESATAIEKFIAEDDLSKLTQEERNTLYIETCASLRINPILKPFQYIWIPARQKDGSLTKRLTFYATKNAADQLRSAHNVSIKVTDLKLENGLAIVRVQASQPNGRVDEEIGIVPIEGLKGNALANAIMAAHTKAKRRVTLSLCSVPYMDETEIATVPGTVAMKVEEIDGDGADVPQPETSQPDVQQPEVPQEVPQKDKNVEEVDDGGRTPPSHLQIAKLCAIFRTIGFDSRDIHKVMGVESFNDLSRSEMGHWIDKFDNKTPAEIKSELRKMAATAAAKYNIGKDEIKQFVLDRTEGKSDKVANLAIKQLVDLFEMIYSHEGS